MTALAGAQLQPLQTEERVCPNSPRPRRLQVSSPAPSQEVQLCQDETRRVGCGRGSQMAPRAEPFANCCVRDSEQVQEGGKKRKEERKTGAFFFLEWLRHLCLLLFCCFASFVNLSPFDMHITPSFIHALRLSLVRGSRSPRPCCL